MNHIRLAEWRMLHLCHLLNGCDIVINSGYGKIYKLAKQVLFKSTDSLLLSLRRYVEQGRYVHYVWANLSNRPGEDFSRYIWRDSYLLGDALFQRGMFAGSSKYSQEKIKIALDLKRKMLDNSWYRDLIVSLTIHLQINKKKGVKTFRLPNKSNEWVNYKDLYKVYCHVLCSSSHEYDEEEGVFYTLLANFGAVTVVGENPHGLRGKVWEFNTGMVDTLLDLIKLPLVCYLK